MDGESSELGEKDSSVCESFRCKNRILTVRQSSMYLLIRDKLTLSQRHGRKQDHPH